MTYSIKPDNDYNYSYEVIAQWRDTKQNRLAQVDARIEKLQDERDVLTRDIALYTERMKTAKRALPLAPAPIRELTPEQQAQIDAAKKAFGL